MTKGERSERAASRSVVEVRPSRASSGGPDVMISVMYENIRFRSDPRAKADGETIDLLEVQDDWDPPMPDRPYPEAR